MPKQKAGNNKTSALMWIAPMVLAGIIYNSWPLGYWLDPSTAHKGLASYLEESHHPYAWVFIAGDIISGLIVIIFAGGLFKKRRLINSFWWKAMVVGLVLFGFFTAFGAGAPNRCMHGSSSLCLTYDHRTAGLDTFETTIAALGLIIVMLSSASLAQVLKLDKPFRWINFGVVLTWFASGSVFTYLIIINADLHFTQQAYLVLSGLGLALIGANAYFSLKKVEA